MKYVLVLFITALIAEPMNRIEAQGKRRGAATTMVAAAPLLITGQPLAITTQIPAPGLSSGLADTATLEGVWVLQPVLPSDTATGKLPFIKFDTGKGRFTGFTGCNRISGSFQKKQDMLSFNTDIVVTKMICEGYNEKDFITNLLRVTEYSIRQGVLTLTINKTPISKWIRENTVTAPVAGVIRPPAKYIYL